MKGHPTGRASVEVLPGAWRKQAKALRRYGGDTPAVALDRCADDLEATLRERDETTLSLVEAAKESGYSADHLGRLVRDGKIPNAGRPGAPRIARAHLPRKATAPVRDDPPLVFSNAETSLKSGAKRSLEDDRDTSHRTNSHPRPSPGLPGGQPARGLRAH